MRDMPDKNAAKAIPESHQKEAKGNTKRPGKQFEARNSPLTDLYANKHIQTVYNVFIAILVGQVLHSAAHDYLRKGRINLGVDLIRRGFSNLHVTLFIWACLFIATLLVYFGFKTWATLRTNIMPKSLTMKIWDRTWLAITVTYYFSFVYFSIRAMAFSNITPTERTAVIFETLRLIMKTHAFIRSNVPTALRHKTKTQEETRLCPKFSRFMYFLWAPTLLYRDSYPRTTSIRWPFVLNQLLGIIAALFFLSFILEKYFFDVFEDYGRKPITWQDAIVIVIQTVPPAMGLMLGLFYMVQHAWMNAFAEILMFADRLFYKEWWTAASYGEYYRTSNTLIQDWIYVYIYRDFYDIIVPKNKMVANYMVFLISSTFHEFITGFTFGFYLPTFLILFFVCGTHVAKIDFGSRTFGNVFVLYQTSLGLSITSSAIALEYFYRQNCPIQEPTAITYFVPRFMTCTL